MDEKHISHVQGNLPELLETTKVTGLLLTKLVAEKVFSFDDVTILETAHSSPNSKADHFYRILLKKENFYEGLLSALRATRQGIPLQVLEAAPSPTLVSSDSNSKLISRVDQVTEWTHWSHLSPRFQDQVMSRRIKFQDRYASLQSVCQDLEATAVEAIMEKTAKGHVIPDLLQDSLDISISGNVGLPPPVYSSRHLSSRRLLNPAFFTKECPDVFVLESIGLDALSRLTKWRCCDTSSNQLDDLTARFISLEDDNHLQKIREVATANQVAVHLVTHKDGKFHWKQTFGSRQNIFEFASIDRELSEDNFLKETLNSSLVLIHPHPESGGMSSLLKSLGRKLKNGNAPVIYIVVHDLLHELRQNPNLTEMYALAMSTSSSEMGRVIVLQFLASLKVSCTILLDAFLPLSSPQLEVTSKVIQILQENNNKVYLGACHSQRTHFEETHETFSYEILAFHESHQVELISKLWQADPENNVKLKDLEVRAKQSLSLFNIAMTTFEEAMLPNPFRSLMVAEAFTDVPCFKVFDSLYSYFATKLRDFTQLEGNDSRNHCQLLLRLLDPHKFLSLPSVTRQVCHDLVHVDILEVNPFGKYCLKNRLLAEFFIAFQIVEGMISKGDSELLMNLLGDTVEVVECKARDDIDFGRIPKFVSYRFRFERIIYFVNNLFRVKNIGELPHLFGTARNELKIAMKACICHDFSYLTGVLLETLEPPPQVEDLMILAAKFGSLPTLACLTRIQTVKSSSPVSKTLPSGNDPGFQITPLQVAVLRGNFEVVNIFLHDFGLESTLKFGTLFLLHFCVRNTAFEENEKLIEEKVRIIQKLVEISPRILEEKLPNSVTPLLQRHLHPEVIKCLIHLGADVNQVSTSGDTVVHRVMAAKTEYREDQLKSIVKALTDANFEHWNSANKDGVVANLQKRLWEKDAFHWMNCEDDTKRGHIKRMERWGGRQPLIRLLADAKISTWEWDSKLVETVSAYFKKLDVSREGPPLNLWEVTSVLKNFDKIKETIALSLEVLTELQLWMNHALNVDLENVAQIHSEEFKAGFYESLTTFPDSYEKLMFALISQRQTTPFVLMRLCLQPTHPETATFATPPVGVVDFILPQEQRPILLIFSEDLESTLQKMKDTLDPFIRFHHVIELDSCGRQTGLPEIYHNSIFLASDFISNEDLEVLQVHSKYSKIVCVTSKNPVRELIARGKRFIRVEHDDIHWSQYSTPYQRSLMPELIPYEQLTTSAEVHFSKFIKKENSFLLEEWRTRVLKNRIGHPKLKVCSGIYIAPRDQVLPIFLVENRLEPDFVIEPGFECCTQIDKNLTIQQQVPESGTQILSRRLSDKLLGIYKTSLPLHKYLCANPRKATPFEDFTTNSASLIVVPPFSHAQAFRAIKLAHRTTPIFKIDFGQLLQSIRGSHRASQNLIEILASESNLSGQDVRDLLTKTLQMVFEVHRATLPPKLEAGLASKVCEEIRGEIPTCRSLWVIVDDPEVAANLFDKADIRGHEILANSVDHIVIDSVLKFWRSGPKWREVASKLVEIYRNYLIQTFGQENFTKSPLSTPKFAGFLIAHYFPERSLNWSNLEFQFETFLEEICTRQFFVKIFQQKQHLLQAIFLSVAACFPGLEEVVLKPLPENPEFEKVVKIITDDSNGLSSVLIQTCSNLIAILLTSNDLADYLLQPHKRNLFLDLIFSTHERRGPHGNLVSQFEFPDIIWFVNKLMPQTGDNPVVTHFRKCSGPRVWNLCVAASSEGHHSILEAVQSSFQDSPRSIDESMIDAVIAIGDVNIMKKMLTSTASLSMAETDGDKLSETLLYVIREKRNICQKVEKLEGSSNPEEFHLDLIKLLVDIGANPNFVRDIRRGCTVLQTAPRYLTLNQFEGLLHHFVKTGKSHFLLSSTKHGTPLHCAMVNLTISEQTLELLQNIPGYDLNTDQDLHQRSLLFKAIEGRQGVGVLNRLLNMGAEITATDSGGNTPLHWAVKFGHVPAVKLLLERGAGVNHQNDEGETPLHLVCKIGKRIHRKVDLLPITQQLVSNGANVDIWTSTKLPFVFAMQQQLIPDKYHKLIELLVEYEWTQVFRTTTEDEENTLLHHAVKTNFKISEDTVLLLAKNGLNLDANNSRWRSALDLTVELQGTRSCIVKTLVTCGAKVEKAYATLFHKCVVNENEKPIYFLRQTKEVIDINERNCVGCAPLIQALYVGGLGQKRKLAMVKALIKAGADVNGRRPPCGQQPLHFTATSGLDDSVDIIVYLIKKGADPLGKDKQGQTFLHCAASFMKQNDFERVFTKLVELLGASICEPKKTKGKKPTIPQSRLCQLLTSTVGEDQVTPLQEALLRMELRKETLQSLRDSNVPMNITDKYGNNLLFYAIRGNCSAPFVILLKKFVGDWKKPGRFGDSVLHQAVSCQNEGAITYFLSLGFGVNARNEYDQTPLHYAFLYPFKGTHGVVERLLRKGADGGAKAMEGTVTPLDIARQKAMEKEVEPRTVELLEKAVRELDN